MGLQECMIDVSLGSGWLVLVITHRAAQAATLPGWVVISHRVLHPGCGTWHVACHWLSPVVVWKLLQVLNPEEATAEEAARCKWAHCLLLDICYSSLFLLNRKEGVVPVEHVVVRIVCKSQEAPLIRYFGHPHGGWGHRSISPPPQSNKGTSHMHLHLPNLCLMLLLLWCGGCRLFLNACGVAICVCHVACHGVDCNSITQWGLGLVDTIL